MIKIDQPAELREDLSNRLILDVLSRRVGEGILYPSVKAKPCPFYQGNCLLGYDCLIKGVTHEYVGVLSHFNDLTGMSVEELYNSHACPKGKFYLSEAERLKIKELLGEFNGL